MISLIIPTIGTGKKEYLEQTLTNAKKTNKNICTELIIIDNSHNQGFSSYLESTVHNLDDSRFIIHKTNEMLSMANNWNFGLSKVTCNWHLYLHDDDYLNLDIFNNLEPNKFKNVGFISFDFFELKGKSSKLTKRSSGIDGIVENTPKFVSTIFNTQFLKKIKGWDDNSGFALDLLAFISLDLKFSSIHYQKPIGYYRIHQENASSKSKRSTGYGDFLPYVLTEAFKLTNDSQIRRNILFHLSSFSYPNQGIIKRGLNFIIRKMSLNAWFK
jgi:hypothetical protein